MGAAAGRGNGTGRENSHHRNILWGRGGTGPAQAGLLWRKVHRRGIPDKTLDAIVESCLLDENMRRWFQEQNPHAMEEASRRFLELNQRGGWQGDPEVLRGLRRAYLSAEGDLEDGISGLGEVQAGGVDIVTHGQADGWGARMAETERLMDHWTKRG